MAEPGLASLRRVGVLGGSFDPPHAGHLHVAEAARAAFDLERVVLVPAGRPPHKPGRRLAPGPERLALLERAIAGRPWLLVSDVELRRAGPSYTIDTLRELPGVLGLDPACALFVIVGDDNLADLPRWHEGEAMLREYRPVVVARDPERLERSLAAVRAALPEALARRVEAGVVRAEPLPISSTAIREALRTGLDPGAVLPPGVLEYARSRGIYSEPR